MSTLALYEHFFPSQSGMLESRQVTIVLHDGFREHEMLARSLARHLRTHAAPTRVVLFGLESHAAFMTEALAAESPFRARLGVAWGAAAEKNACFGVVFGNNPESYRVIGIESTFELAEKEAKLAAAMTAQAIFTESKCLQVAPRGIHFSKTSKAHCNTFIRASNALVKSQHTLTLAYWILPFVAQPAKRILVDTSAIASVVYAACHVAIQVGIRPEMPIIDSFQSYEGLSDADLEDIENTLFVISASTSGNLARKAFKRGIKRHRLQTIYLLSEKQQDQDALCQLRKHQDTNPEGLDLLNSWDESECALCRQGSMPIQIGGDLFLTALPETDAITLVKKHLPDDQRDTISRFAGHGIFRAYRRIGDRTTEISIDLAPAFHDGVISEEIVTFGDDWQRLLRRYVPANMTHLVYPEYPFALELAQGIESFASQFVKEPVTPTSGRDLVDTSAQVNGSAVVVTPCVHNVVEMMGINRDLRSKIPGGTAIYLFPFIRAQSKAQVQGMLTNLTFGDRGPGTYSQHSLCTLYLPEDRVTNPWDRELNCLKALGDWVEEQGEEVPPELTGRRKRLHEATATGMTDTLFWPDSAGKMLSIRSNFVLLTTKDGTRRLDQADIFVVVSALLNNLRLMDQGDGLRNSQYQRKILAPGNFVRFNDGVIQSALLRAARDDELNYVATDDGKYSSEMTDHIEGMVGKAKSHEGEALTEFVLAIAVGALRLEPIDLESLNKTIYSNAENVPPIVLCMAKAIDEGILPLVTQ